MEHIGKSIDEFLNSREVMPDFEEPEFAEEIDEFLKVLRFRITVGLETGALNPSEIFDFTHGIVGIEKGNLLYCLFFFFLHWGVSGYPRTEAWLVEMVNYILSKGGSCDINEEGWFDDLLVGAIYDNNVAVARLILETSEACGHAIKHPSKDISGATSLEMVKLLVERGGDVNYAEEVTSRSLLQSITGEWLFSKSATPEEQEKAIATVKELLEMGADATFVSEDGVTTIDRVALAPIAILLIEAGAVLTPRVIAKWIKPVTITDRFGIELRREKRFTNVEWRRILRASAWQRRKRLLTAIKDRR